MVFDVLLHTIILPLLLAGVLHGVGFVRADSDSLRARVAPGVSALAAFLSAYFWIRGVPSFPPTSSNDWLGLVSLGLVALIFVENFLPRAVLWGVRGVFTFAAFRAVLNSKFQYGWETSSGYLVVGGVAALALLQWVSLTRLSQRSGGTVFALVLAGYAGLSAVVLGLASSVTLAQMGGAVAISMLVTALAALRAPVRFDAAISAIIPVIGLLIVSGRVYADLTSLSALLLGAVPVLAWFGELGPWRTNAWTRATAHIVALAVPVGVAGWLSVRGEVLTEPAPGTPSTQVDGAEPVEDEPYDPYAAGGNDPDYDPYQQ